MWLIEADELLKKAYERGKWMPILVVNADDILDAPTIDAEPVRHGAWENYPGHTYRRCSVCKTEWEKPKFNIRSNYCPNCGAKMDKGVEA